MREAWQNWGLTIIENEDVADIWVRGNAAEALDRVEDERYEDSTDKSAGGCTSALGTKERFGGPNSLRLPARF
ncbi:MAG: hypothetical protein E2O59_01915 [Gammaproteobacteria bacterium]|nr:MAG: hypothetical protein E2O59_01915 [Gammaproteobacteria bacterium]